MGLQWLGVDASLLQRLWLPALFSSAPASFCHLATYGCACRLLLPGSSWQGLCPSLCRQGLSYPELKCPNAHVPEHSMYGSLGITIFARRLQEFDVDPRRTVREEFYQVYDQQVRVCVRGVLPKCLTSKSGNVCEAGFRGGVAQAGWHVGVRFPCRCCVPSRHALHTLIKRCIALSSGHTPCHVVLLYFIYARTGGSASTPQQQRSPLDKACMHAST